MPSDDIFRLLMIVLLLTNNSDTGDFSSINDAVIAALLASSCNSGGNGNSGCNCANNQNSRCGCPGTNTNTSF